MILNKKDFSGTTIMEGNIILSNKLIAGTIETQTIALQWRFFLL